MKNWFPSTPTPTRFVTQPVTRRALQALSAGILLATPLQAADIQWTGGDGIFNDAANWSGGVVPGGGDAAIISNGSSVVVTDASYAVGGISVSEGGIVFEPSSPGPGITNTGSTLIGHQTGGLGKFDLKGGAYSATGTFIIGSGGGMGMATLTDGMIGATGGDLVIGQGNGSDGELVQAGGFIQCMVPWVVGTGTGAEGLLELNATSAAALAMNSLVIASDGAAGTLKIKSGSLNKVAAIPNTHAAFGRGDGSVAVVEHTGGLFTNTDTDTYLGESGSATASWTLSGASSTAVFATLIMGNADSASGTFTANGGTLNVRRIIKGASTGDATLVFDGGTLMPRNSEPDFVSGIDSLTVEEGGIFVDTYGYTIGIAQDLLDGGGGLTKKNEGTLSIEGSALYAGATIVEGGTLLVNGTLTASDVEVQSGGSVGGAGTISGSITSAGTIAPGYGVGTLTVGQDVAVTGKLAVELTPSGSDVLAVAGDLNVEGATLRIELPDGDPLTEPYVIATYGTRSGGAFAGIENGDGYQIDYAYQGNKIAVTPGTSPFADWASGYEWVAEGDELPDADPDGDGFANVLEFFLAGDPLQSGPPAGRPAGSVVGDHFVFTFQRSAAAASIAPVIEYGTSLDLPLVAADGAEGVSISTGESPGGQTWTVSIPMSPGGKLFARLKVEITP